MTAGRASFHGAIGLAICVLNGCVTMQSSPGLSAVRDLAAQHGITRVHWRQGTSEDTDAAEAVRSMLADGLTGEEAIQIALLNNRDLQSTYEQLRIVQADVVQAGLLKNPVFDGSIRFVASGGSPVTDLGIAFDFLDVFFIPLRKGVAESEFATAQLRVTGEVVDLAGKATTTFYALQAAEQTLEMWRTSLAAYDAAYEMAERIRAAGNSTRLQLANEQAAYEEAKLAVVDAETDVITIHETLNGIMGLFGPAGQWRISERLPEIPPDPFDAESLEAGALERSLDLRIARSEIDVAAKRLGITKPLGLLSDLELGALAERDGEWSVGPSAAFALPVFSQGQPAVTQARAQLTQALNRYYSTAITVRVAVRTAYARTQATRRRASHLQKVILPLRKFIVDESQKAYNAMLVGTFELLQAKRDHIEAGRRYIKALRDYWIARSELAQIANGRLVNNGVGALAAEEPSVADRNRGGH